MICGSCSFTDKLCYCSMPPQVKCIITNEFHYYDDECNCEESRANRKEELDYTKRKLNESSPILAINYDGPKAPSVAFCNINANADNIDINSDQRSPENATAVAWGATSCLVCGEDVQLEGWWAAGPKICPTCRKAVKFIKENFSKELEVYEL